MGDMDWPHHVFDAGPITPTEGVDALASAATRDGGAALGRFLYVRRPRLSEV